MNNIINVDFNNKVRLPNNIKQHSLPNPEIFGKRSTDFISSDNILEMGFTEIDMNEWQHQSWEYEEDYDN